LLKWFFAANKVKSMKTTERKLHFVWEFFFWGGVCVCVGVCFVVVVVSRKTGLKIFQKYPPNEWFLYLWFFLYGTTNAGISREFFSLNNFALLAFFAFGMSWQNINISPMPALLTLGGESRCINVSFLGFTILHLLLLLQFQFVVSLKQIIVIWQKWKKKYLHFVVVLVLGLGRLLALCFLRFYICIYIYIYNVYICR